MHLNRLRLGEITAAVGAVVLLVSLFLDWVSVTALVYFGQANGSAATATQSGFEGAGILLVLLLLIVAALALTVVVLTVAVEPVGLTMSAIVATSFFGIVATIATLLRVGLFQPDLGAGLGDSMVTMEVGAYVSLVGVFLCAAGGWTAMRDERMDAPYSAAPELEPRPAPPAAPNGLA